MKVLLIKPYWPRLYSKGEYTYNRAWPPLSLANCAGILEKNGFEAKILDCHVLGIKPKDIKNYIKGFDKIFVTSSSLDRWQCPNVDISSFLLAIQHIRIVTDEVYVMGYHGTVQSQKMLEASGAKAVIQGEPERTVLEICLNNSFRGIKGLTFKEAGQVVSTLEREPLDLKEISLPAFHLLDFKKYSYEILGGNFSLFEMSRGCKFKCKFCNKVMYGEKIRSKSGKRIFEEVTLAIEKYNVRTGYFIDLDFFSNKENAQALCDYLIEKRYRFRWTCQVRPDSLDSDILKKMKKAGCGLIHVGIETGSQDLADCVNKSVNLSKVNETLELCGKIGIKVLAFFLFGLPNETDKDRDSTFKFIKKISPDFISLHKVYPYRGTDIFKDNFEPELTPDKFIRKAYLQYYLRPSYLKKVNISILLKGLKLFCSRIRTLS